MNNTTETLENTDESLFAYLEQIDETKKMLSDALGQELDWEITEELVGDLLNTIEENINNFKDQVNSLNSKINYLNGKRAIEMGKQEKVSQIKETMPLIWKIEKIAYSNKSFEKKIWKIMTKLAQSDPKRNINVFSLSTVDFEDTRELRKYAEEKLSGRRNVNWQKILASVIWMDDEKAWEIREKYFTEEAYYKEDEDNEWIVDILDMYLNSLQAIDTPKAWEIREKYFNWKKARPRSRSRGDSKLYESVVARDDGNFELPGLIRSLGTIDTSRAWEMREEVLSKLEANKKSDGDFSFDLADAVLKSLKGINSNQAWKMRKRITKLYKTKSYIYKGLLFSMIGLDNDKSWKIRNNIFNNSDLLGSRRDIENVCYYITGLDSDKAWELRFDLIRRGFIAEVVGSLGKLDSNRAWKIRLYCLKNAIDINNVLIGMSGGSFSI